MWILTGALAAGSSIDEARELQRRGKLEAAHEMLALASKEFRASGDRPNLVRALGIAADISVSLGRYTDAVTEATEALNLRRALRDQAKIGDDYNTLGLAHQYLGDYPAALNSYRKAFDSDRAQGDVEGEVTRLNNIGNVFYFQGHYSDALAAYEDATQRLSDFAAEPWYSAKRQLTIANLAALFQRLGQEPRALEYYRQLAGAPHSMASSEQAQLLLNEGALYRRLGDPVKALELYRSAQALFATDRHRDGEIGALRNIGIALALDLNDFPRALAAFSRAVEMAQRSSNNRGLAQARLYRGELLRRLRRTEEAQSDLRAALRDAQSSGLVEEQWKALYALGKMEGTEEAAAEDYRQAISVIESVRSGLRLTSLRNDFLADKRDVYDSLIDLRLRNPATTPGEIFNWMERSRARTLLDRVRTRVPLLNPELGAIQSRLAPGMVLVEFWMGADHAAALWMTKTGAGLVHYGDVLKFGADASASSDRIFRDIPLANHLIVVPDGMLSTIPFETFHLPQSSTLLIEKCDVSYLPSARFLIPGSHPRWLTPWATEILILADPPVASGLFGEVWDPLPGSAGEARAIGQLMPGRARIYLDGDAQKRYLISAAARGVPLLHLATHAMIDAENPDRSRILLAHDYLFQEEVYDLDLTKVDLVTLSACDTAHGKFVRGESAQAFSQAFLAAGASAAVTTLWRVADQPTADFMKQFYYELAQGQSKASALRSAKLRFLRSNSRLAEPRYWAAFILNGNGSAAVPRAIPWSYCLAAAALVILIVTWGFTAWRKSGRTE